MKLSGRLKFGWFDKVERFGAKLQRQAFPDLRVLHQRQVQRLKRRPLENVASGIPEGAERRNRKRRGVEPKVRVLTVEMRIAHHVRPVIGAAKAQDGGSGVAVVESREQRHGERLARLET